MRKFYISIIFILICSDLLQAQNKWAVSYTPTAIVLSPRISYGIQPGVEYKVNQRFIILTEITFNANRDKDSSFTDPKYFRIKPELRYKLEKHGRWLGNYLGLQLSYSHRKWNDLSGGSYFLKTGFEDSAISYQQATISSPVLTASLLLGSIIKTGDHFSIDFFFGMGARTIFTNYSNVQNPTKQYRQRPKCGPLFGLPAAYTIDRTITRFHMNSGVRFLYYF
jgi:hypothetical protein